MSNLTTVKLEKRTGSFYRKSGYSFRYQTIDEQKHRNYVDLVYEAGKMRINNHGGMKCRIADLGTETDVKKATAQIKNAKWSKDLLVPKAGQTYSLEITEGKHKMHSVFHVTKVAEKQIEFVWQPDKTKKWPIAVGQRGAAGCSGMMGASSRPR